MDPTLSLSKGCFVFNGGHIKAKKKTPRKYSKSNILPDEMQELPFYKVYKGTWQAIQKHIQELQNASNQRMLDDLVSYVRLHSKLLPNEFCLDANVLPTAVLLTGINQPDHLLEFHNLAKCMQEQIPCSISLLHSHDGLSVKSAVETLIFNLIQNSLLSSESHRHSSELNSADDDDDDSVLEKKNSAKKPSLKRSQCTIRHLKRWYYNNWPINKKTDETEIESNQRHMLVVILPDFECFASNVLQDVILLLSNHCMDLPFILILGVATSIAVVHQALPCHVTTKMSLRLFQAATAPMRLNEILDKVILSPRYAFHLSGKSLKFLTDIFLYYDFSITGFIQGYQYCMMEHFFQGNAYILCTTYNQAICSIENLSPRDLECIRQLHSFRPYVEQMSNDPKSIIALLTDDHYFMRHLLHLIKDCHFYYIMMRIALELLVLLVEDLPKHPLGKYRRELYATCLSKDVLQMAEFRECWKLLSFLSKQEFVEKVRQAVTRTREFSSLEIFNQFEFEFAECLQRIVMGKLSRIENLLDAVSKAGLRSTESEATVCEPLASLTSRHDLKQKLLQMSKQPKSVNEFTKCVQNCLKYIEDEFLAEYLRPLHKAPPLHELYFFGELTAVQRNILGSPRAALQMALSNPNFYLQCKCCGLSGEHQQSQIMSTMPDICIAYKLHLEYGRLINLYDWLQAFRCIVDYNENDDDDGGGGGGDGQQEQISPEIQARYTRAIAELQFLGYIKVSKRKTDHVQRLTW